MTKAEIMSTVTRKLNKVGPEILAVAGGIGVVTSAVMACKATLKVNDILDDAKNTVEKIHEVREMPEMVDKYTEEDSKKDLAIVYIQTGVKLIKLYGPSVLLGTASLGCIFTSHKILRKRNMALAAAYATVDRGFKEYRSRVVERFGKELDRELKYNIRAKEIEEVVVNEDGTQTSVENTVEAVDPNVYSEYARFYDDGCLGWSKSSEDNLYFLKCQQNHANELLQAKGHLFLNEVYDMLGIPRTKAGQVVGWVYDKDNCTGDNFVDFGIYDLYNERARAFVNGHERTILLDFNVDGNVWDLL